jgi:hypothetical protein
MEFCEDLINGGALTTADEDRKHDKAVALYYKQLDAGQVI